MRFMPIVKQTQVNLAKGEFLAGKNLKKRTHYPGEGRAQRNLRKLLNRRLTGQERGILKKNREPGFFAEKSGLMRFLSDFCSSQKGR